MPILQSTIAEAVRVKYKYVEGALTNVAANSEAILASVTVNANEFSNWYVVIAYVGGDSSSAEEDTSTTFFCYLKRDGVAIKERSTVGLYYPTGNYFYSGPGPTFIHLETDVTNPHTFDITVLNHRPYPLNNMIGTILVLGV